ncbi:MAG: hypothetical protein ABMA02_16950 [Saprospiraceae bacterium]
MKHTHVLFVLFIFGSVLCNAQTTQAPTSVPQGRLFTTEGKKIKFTSLSIGDKEHTFRAKPDSNQQTILASSVVLIQKQNGTKAGSFALIFGGVGMGLGLIAVSSLSNSSLFDLNTSQSVAFVLTHTSVYALIGVGIGAITKRYETVYDKRKPSNSTSLGLKVISPTPYSIGVGLSLSLGNTSR